MTLTVDEAGRALADPKAYADDRRFHDALALLRRESPVHWVDATPDYTPFWAITRHEDVLEIERNHQVFLNEPRPILGTAEFDEMNRERVEQGIALRTLIHMDDPDHRVIRAIGADWFRPRAMRALEPRVRELAKRYVDRMVDLGGECDFAREVAVHFPLYVILSLLGLPESDFDRMLKLTQELFGGDDDELQRGTTNEEKLQVLLDFFAYFQGLTEARRKNPTDDLASAIANARVDGEPLNDFDTASYYVIIATAGHDTTSATIAGGLHALIEHPDQLDRLREKPELLPLAVDEMIRWVTPVKEFMRTASEDYELRGTTIRKGDAVLLSYPSANRDEDVFDDPFRFDVGRDPNKHLAFGFGVHYCLGAALARIEVRAFFEELLPRLNSIEPAGTPESIATTFVGGLKRLPVRYSIA
ncbi:cytochrome P450 [Actinomadura madurae]|uniref:cytochrome P450 n=1 Tax=Actinomadura madurae TaxID=1993 RepID=UPI002025EC28|nr:cytochrome P450 [Actinomadura madurae]MCP9981741.1 cytochrome P450 [Actinomadura madurae]URM98025.1 cytochrome P450 [Actinomadura madurae]URN08713.1 cytochrome P450 [Actinomadura madurae]